MAAPSTALPRAATSSRTNSTKCFVMANHKITPRAKSRQALLVAGSSALRRTSPMRTSCGINAVCVTPALGVPTRVDPKKASGGLHIKGRAQFGQPRVPVAAGAARRISAETISAVEYVRVVAPTSLAMLLMNIDRICMSIAIIPMAQQFGWPASVQGLVSASFLWGYMATQLLSGTLADRFGAKLTMAVGIVWFSSATMLMPTVLSNFAITAGATLTAVMFCRAAVGMGEGMILPSMNSMLASTIPPVQRSSALGSVFTGFHCGNLVGLAATPFLLQQYGWQGVFVIFGSFGLPVLLIWLAAIPAARKKQMERNERTKMIEESNKRIGIESKDPGFVDLLRTPAVWAIVVANFVNHWGYFIYLNWLPSYFNTALGFDLRSSSLLAFLPWAVMAAGSAASGAVVDMALQAGYDIKLVRRLVQTIAFAGPVVALLILGSKGAAVSPAVAVVCFVATLGISSLGQAGFVANMSDIAPKHAGRLFGYCNTFGSLAGIIGVSAVGFIVERTGSFVPVFFLTAALYCVGILCWNCLLSTDVQFS